MAKSNVVGLLVVLMTVGCRPVTGPQPQAQVQATAGTTSVPSTTSAQAEKFDLAAKRRKVVEQILVARGFAAKPDVDQLLREWKLGNYSLNSPQALALSLVGEPVAALPLARGSLAYARELVSIRGTHPPPPELSQAVIGAKPLLRIAELHGLDGVRAALEDPDPAVARHTAIMLADSADPQVTAFILKRLADGKLSYDDFPNGPVSHETRDVLIAIAAKQRSKDEPQTRARSQAIRLLGCISRDPKVLAFLRSVPPPGPKYISDEHECAYEAAVALADADPSRAVELLRAMMLTGTDPYGKHVAALREIPGRQATEALVAGLGANSGYIIRPCRDALIARKDMRAVPILVESIGPSGKGRSVCTIAVEVLWGLRVADADAGGKSGVDWRAVEKAVVAALTKVLAAESDYPAGAEALGTCPRELAIPPLMVAYEKNPDRFVILGQLIDLEAKDAIPLCVKLARSAPTTVGRAGAIEFLAKFNAPQALEICLAAIDEKDLNLRYAGAWGLARIGHKPSRDKVLAMLADKDMRPLEGMDKDVLAFVEYAGAAKALDLMAGWGFDERIVRACAKDERSRCVEILLAELEAMTRMHGGEETPRGRARMAGMLAELKADDVVAIADKSLKNEGNYSMGDQAAIEVLGDLGSPAAIAMLKAWSTPKHYMLPLCARQLVRLKQADTFDIIMTGWPADGRPPDAQTIAEAIRLAPYPQAAKDRLADKLADMQRRDAKTLSGSVLFAIVSGQFVIEPAQALDMVGDSRGAELVGRLIVADQFTPMYYDLTEAVGVLGAMKHPMARAVLRALLDDPRRSVRVAAAAQLRNQKGNDH